MILVSFLNSISVFNSQPVIIRIIPSIAGDRCTIHWSFHRESLERKKRQITYLFYSFLEPQAFGTHNYWSISSSTCTTVNPYMKQDRLFSRDLPHSEDDLIQCCLLVTRSCDDVLVICWYVTTQHRWGFFWLKVEEYCIRKHIKLLPCFIYWIS